MLLRNLFFAAATAHAFVLPPAPRTTRLQMMPPKPGDMTPESMRQAADALKTLKPDQIQQMLKEVEDMSPEERERLKGNGPVHKSTSESGARENAAVLAGTRGNRPQCHAIELASRRWRGGHGSAVAETRRDNLIYALTTTPHSRLSASGSWRGARGSAAPARRG